MTTPPDFASVAADVADAIRHKIKPRLGEFRRFRSTRELLASPLYQELSEPLLFALHSVHTGQHARPAGAKGRYKVVAWNIERGKQLERQIEAFRTDDRIRDADLVLLTETDVGMARSGNVDVARILARELEYDYAFVPCYLSLVNGSGLERHVEGDNDLGLHGNSILSRYPIERPYRIGLENGIDKMASNEQRLGEQTALGATIRFPERPVSVACVHLDANSTQRHRAVQMRRVLDTLPAAGPALVGGDWNTTTFNSSSAFHAIMGYWLRVFMGPKYVIRNHYLHPYRWFERHLFNLLESRGFNYKNANEDAAPTIFYHVDDVSTHKILAEWVPGWCFPFIRWALKHAGGGCPLKIDWFAARELETANPRVIPESRAPNVAPMSDHDAITVEIVL